MNIDIRNYSITLQKSTASNITERRYCLHLLMHRFMIIVQRCLNRLTTDIQLPQECRFLKNVRKIRVLTFHKYRFLFEAIIFTGL